MSREDATYRIRIYRDGDEKELAILFNNVYKEYAGYVPRTPDFWLWCCKNRPGVQEEGIVIAELDQRVVGYAVVSTSGEILEFCYDSKHAADGLVLRLLEVVESYLKTVGASSITLNAPNDDPLVREICKKMGYAESSPSYALQLSLISLPELLRVILLPKIENLKAHFNGGILLKMKQSAPMDYACISLKILDDGLLVEEKTTEDPSFTIEANKQAFTSCIFGNMNLLAGVLTGKIRVSPFWKVSRALDFLSLLKLDDQWYLPIADYG